MAAAIGNDELNKFFTSLRKVLSPEIVVAAAARNPLIQDAHRAVREAVAKGWTLRFIFVTTGYLSAEGRIYAETNSTDVEVLDSAQVQKELEVYDLEGLLRLYESHLSPTRLLTDVDLDMPGAECTETKIAGFRVLLATVCAREIVRAFREHKYALFRLNPRGPLQNKVNREILATLKDPERRKLFFHLNNGITAVCQSFRRENGRIRVRDLQIVNGCQTTVTLDKAGPIVEGDEEIKILLRLIEGLAPLHKDIATATNSQARLTAQDFKSNDPLQQDLKNRFDALPTPIFYEVKRGDWEMAGEKQRYRDAESRAYRRIKMKDLAQAALAYLGEPGDAKDRSRSIFENESRYKEVFPDDVTPEQLMLPWEVYREADSACGTWQFAAAQYARYCLTALVGLNLSPDKKLPAVRDAARLRADRDRITHCLTMGQQAIAGLVAALGDDYPGPREFFRSADFFRKVRRAYEAQPS